MFFAVVIVVYLIKSVNHKSKIEDLIKLKRRRNTRKFQQY